MSGIKSKKAVKKKAIRRTKKLPLKKLLSKKDPPKKQPKRKKSSARDKEFAVGLVENVRTVMGKAKIPTGKGKEVEVFNQRNISLLSDGGILSDVTEWIPTGFIGLDHILGGGWAVGRCSEVYGPEGHGKTALAHRAIKACQDVGGYACLLDFEVALDKPKMRQLKIDPDRLIYFSPEDMEQGWDMFWATLDYTDKHPPKRPMLYVWDSVAASVPRAERLEESAADGHVGLQARIMGKGCRRLFRRIARVRAHMMFINQERDKMGGRSMYQEAVTPGGRAVKFAASARVRVRKVSTESVTKNGVKRAVNYLVSASTQKCRLFPPHRNMTWVLDFKYGPSPELTLFRDLVRTRHIKKADEGGYVGSWSRKKFQKSAWFEMLEDPEFRANAEALYQLMLDRDEE